MIGRCQSPAWGTTESDLWGDFSAESSRRIKEAEPGWNPEFLSNPHPRSTYSLDKLLFFFFLPFSMPWSPSPLSLLRSHLVQSQFISRTCCLGLRNRMGLHPILCIFSYLWRLDSQFFNVYKLLWRWKALHRCQVTLSLLGLFVFCLVKRHISPKCPKPEFISVSHTYNKAASHVHALVMLRAV
jgi:hypothetical protein